MKTNDAIIKQFDANEFADINNQVMTFDNLKNILNSLPYIVAILNSNRQIVFSNTILIDSFNISSIEDILGLRTGDILKCVNTKKVNSICGSTEGCNYCGAVQAITISQKNRKKITQECRITSRLNGHDVSFDFLVTAIPFNWNKEKYTVLSLNDISNTKRRLALERIFFHDIINKVGSLNGFLELLKEIDDPVKIKQFINEAFEISSELTDDIVSQKELLAAESDELLVHKTNINTLDLMKRVVKHIRHHEVARGKTININSKSVNMSFYTDTSIFKRVLSNLIKNAVEAISPGEKVTLGCNHKQNSIYFWVHNPTFIPKDVETQIFQRSFSTKGNNRGLGTYSIKLLTEKYLDGEVQFTTDKKRGTKFFLKFPIEVNFNI